jgi:hypothetical protein
MRLKGKNFFLSFSAKRHFDLHWEVERAKTTTAPSKEVNEMYGTDTRTRAADEELIEVLIAISVVSKRLARKLTDTCQSESTQGRRKSR